MDDVSGYRWSSQFDDQGVIFALIVSFGGWLLLFLVTLGFQLSESLWIKRLFRPNHTKKPSRWIRAGSIVAATAPVGATCATAESPREGDAPPPPAEGCGTAETNGVAAPLRTSPLSPRFARAGVSLPFRSSMLSLPRWRNWLAVEDTAGHVRGNITGGVEAGPLPPRTSSTPSLSPAHRNRGQRSWKTEDDERTPLDPQVALYLFTLRSIILLLLGGLLLTAVLASTYGTDDYIPSLYYRLDLSRCRERSDNRSECESHVPYCVYHNSTCTPTRVRGMYVYAAQNLRPHSWRFWMVGWFELTFVIFYAIAMVWYIAKVQAYINVLLERQMRHAHGYRVAIVRGIDPVDSNETSPVYQQQVNLRHPLLSKENFIYCFLREEAYFAPPPRPRHAGTRASITATPPPPPPSTWYERHDRIGKSQRGPHYLVESWIPALNEYADGEYEQCDCTGLSCCFSAIGFEYYTTTRKDAVFTQPGKVEDIIFLRDLPLRMSWHIMKAKSAKGKLEEVIAETKRRERQAVRRHTLRQRALRQQASWRSGATSAVVVPIAAGVDRGGGGGGDLLKDLPSAPPAVVTNPVPDKAVALLTTDPVPVVEPVTMMADLPLGCCCSRVPELPYRKEEFRRAVETLNEDIRMAPQAPPIGAAYVVFADALSAFEFVNLFEARFGGILATENARIAGPHQQIIHSNVDANKYGVWARTLVVMAAYLMLLFFWSIPVGLLSSLENIARIPGIGSSLIGAYHNLPVWIRGIITAYLPVVVLAIFNLVLPWIMRGFAYAMGGMSKTEVESGVLHMQYLFRVLTGVIFQAALQGGVAQLAFLITEPNRESWFNFFVSIVSPQGGYWYAKLLTMGFITNWVSALEIPNLVVVCLFRKSTNIQRVYDAMYQTENFDYAYLYSVDLFALAVALIFHMTAPLLLIPSFIYFVTRYVTQRGRLLDRYCPERLPHEDCTDFTVSTQVVRAVSWLFALGATCNVLLVSLRRHVGGVVLCSIAMALAIVTMIYVHIATRRWSASLANARRFFDAEAKGADLHQYGTTSPNGTPPAASLSEVPPPPGVEGNRDHSGNTNRPACDSYSSASGSDDLAMATFEVERFSMTAVFEYHNPFAGALLPCREAASPYEPMPLRLKVVDAGEEIQRLEQTPFVIERFWDLPRSSFDASCGTGIGDLVHRACGWCSCCGCADGGHGGTGRGHIDDRYYDDDQIMLDATEVQSQDPRRRHHHDAATAASAIHPEPSEDAAWPEVVTVASIELVPPTSPSPLPPSLARAGSSGATLRAALHGPTTVPRRRQSSSSRGSEANSPPRVTETAVRRSDAKSE